jgi:hypothetical protein
MINMGRKSLFWGCLALAVVAAWICAPSAHAGTVIELNTTYFDGSKPDENTMIYLEEGRLRFEAVESGKEMTLIVTLDDAGEPVCWVIDTKEKTYTEITRESANKVKVQIEQGKKQMEEQLKAMPEEQRAQMREMMNNQIGQFDKAAKIKFKQVASGVEINKWKCVQYESLIDEEKHEDIWAADWEQIGLKKTDAEILKKFGSLFEGISPETNAFFHTGGSESAGGFDGFPVLVVEYKEGAKFEKSEVTSIGNKKLEGDLFALPEGFTKVSLFDR